jgi:hypothetical protein
LNDQLTPLTRVELSSRSYGPIRNCGDTGSEDRLPKRPIAQKRLRQSANRLKTRLSVVFAGQSVDIKQVSEHIWLASFVHYDLGYIDHETCRLEPIENPFGPKVLPVSPE